MQVIRRCQTRCVPPRSPDAKGYGSLPDRFTGLIFSNEFFDAIPVDLVVAREGRSYERRVTLVGGGFGWDDTRPSAEPVTDRVIVRELQHYRLDWLTRLAGRLDRGLIVTRFHYTNPVHSKKVIITGMTRDGTFLVENGQVVGAVRNLRFTMSYLDALCNVEAVSAERRCIRGFLGASVVPSVRLSSFSFTGATAAEPT